MPQGRLVEDYKDYLRVWTIWGCLALRLHLTSNTVSAWFVTFYCDSYTEVSIVIPKTLISVKKFIEDRVTSSPLWAGHYLLNSSHSCLMIFSSYYTVISIFYIQRSWRISYGGFNQRLWTIVFLYTIQRW